MTFNQILLPRGHLTALISFGPLHKLTNNFIFHNSRVLNVFSINCDLKNVCMIVTNKFQFIRDITYTHIYPVPHFGSRSRAQTYTKEFTPEMMQMVDAQHCPEVRSTSCKCSKKCIYKSILFSPPS